MLRMPNNIHAHITTKHITPLAIIVCGTVCVLVHAAILPTLTLGNIVYGVVSLITESCFAFVKYCPESVSFLD